MCVRARTHAHMCVHACVNETAFVTKKGKTNFLPTSKEGQGKELWFEPKVKEKSLTQDIMEKPFVWVILFWIE